MDHFEQLQRFFRLVRIAHHIPGRIRLKLETGPDDSLMAALGDAKRFGSALDDIPGVHAVKLNLLAQSCTIEYDARTIPVAAWPDLLGGVRSTAAEVLWNILATRYREAAGA